MEFHSHIDLVRDTVGKLSDVMLEEFDKVREELQAEIQR